MPESQNKIGVNLENSRLGTGDCDAVKCVNGSGTKKQSGQVGEAKPAQRTLRAATHLPKASAAASGVVA